MSVKKGSHVIDLLESYIKRELDQATAEKVKTHLIFCNVCRDFLDGLEKFASPEKKSKREVPVPNPKSKILPESPEPLLKGMDWRFPLKSAGLLALAALVFAVFKTVKKDDIPKPKPENKIVDSSPKPVENSPKIETSPTATSAPVIPKEPKATEKPHPSIEPQRQDPSPLAQDDNLGSGAMSGIQEEFQQIISNEDDWKALWSRHRQGGGVEKSEAPVVDFDHNEVAAVFAGSKPSAGYSIEITDVQSTIWNGAPARVVIYRVKGPPPGAFAAAVMTAPFAFKRLPKFEGPTYFRNIP